MPTSSETDALRPRLALVLASAAKAAPGPEAVERALAGGDVATVFLVPSGRGPAEFQDYAEAVVPIVQAAGAAAIVVDDTRCAGRVGADGIHITTGDGEEIRDAIARFHPRLIVGVSGLKARHEALEVGELMPDYVFFGRLAGAPDAAPQERDLELAAWWAPIVEIPCIVMGGADMASLSSVAATGAEFIALSSAVFAEEGAEGEAVARANALLDEAGEGLAA